LLLKQISAKLRSFESYHLPAAKAEDAASQLLTISAVLVL
jgi:hypothetical protein